MAMMDPTRDRAISQMQRGPRLDPISDTIIVPSAWYNEKAARLWSEQGFRFNDTLKAWLRNTGTAATNGRHYSREQWLEAARRHFFELYPEAVRHCAGCGKQIFPRSRWQTLCTECENHHAGKWR